MSHSVYMGGSRHLSQDHPVYGHIAPVLRSVLASGCAVHVGCQSGADQTILLNGLRAPLSLFVFAVAASLESAPAFVERAFHAGASVTLAAGGSESTPIKARYLLRSIAAFQGCEQAVFFSPGEGSLAVARECVRSGLPVFAFGSQPARVPSVSGQWVKSSFMGFSCWQWAAPTQASLF